MDSDEFISQHYFSANSSPSTGPLEEDSVEVIFDNLAYYSPRSPSPGPFSGMSPLNNYSHTTANYSDSPRSPSPGPSSGNNL